MLNHIYKKIGVSDNQKLINIDKFGNRLNEKKSRRENILAKGNDYVNNPLLGELR